MEFGVFVTVALDTECAGTNHIDREFRANLFHVNSFIAFHRLEKRLGTLHNSGKHHFHFSGGERRRKFDSQTPPARAAKLEKMRCDRLEFLIVEHAALIKMIKMFRYYFFKNVQIHRHVHRRGHQVNSGVFDVLLAEMVVEFLEHDAHIGRIFIVWIRIVSEGKLCAWIRLQASSLPITEGLLEEEPAQQEYAQY